MFSENLTNNMTLPKFQYPSASIEQGTGELVSKLCTPAGIYFKYKVLEL